jgi:hypothetical protein
VSQDKNNTLSITILQEKSPKIQAERFSRNPSIQVKKTIPVLERYRLPTLLHSFD